MLNKEDRDLAAGFGDGGLGPVVSEPEPHLMRRAMLALKQSWRALPDSAEVLSSHCYDLSREIQDRLGRDGEHCMCPACREGVLHASSCAVHNEPALPVGPCDCDYDCLARRPQ
jgi:hypothetical protein